jgi:PKD repeat protein
MLRNTTRFISESLREIVEQDVPKMCYSQHYQFASLHQTEKSITCRESKTHDMKKLLLLVSLIAVLEPSFASTFTVNSLAATNTGSGNSGTLRYCMNIATITPGGPHTIVFSVAGTIAIGSDANLLPNITSSGLFIDGTTAPGFVDAPVVMVDFAGTTSGNGFNVNTSFVAIWGIDVNNAAGTGIAVSATGNGFDIGWCVARNSGTYGIQVNSALNGSIHDSWIGVDQTGNICGMNQYDGIDIQNGGSHQVINNHIACNGYNGIQLGSSDNNVIQGNIIGPLEGTCNYNGYRGVDVEGGSQNNIIGGTGTGEANKISGNEYYGVEVKEAGSTGNIISGNSMSCNVYSAIDVNTGGNNDLAAPVITAANGTTVSGTSSPNAVIEVFLAQDATVFGCAGTPVEQGADYIGSTNADGTGAWSLTGTFTGMVVATQQTLVDGTSAFSNAFNTGVAATWVNECAGPALPVGGPAPVADFSITPSTICAGECIDFADLSTNSPTSWAWTFAGGIPSTSTNSTETVCFPAPGVYSITLDATNANGTGTVSYDVTVLPLPAIVITQNGAELAATNGHTSYLWYLNGIPIAGATDDTLAITSNGDYTCEATGVNGCSDTSAVFTVTDMGFDYHYFANQVKVYPNPASERIYITTGQALNVFSYIVITDVAGNVVHTAGVECNSEAQLIAVDFLSNGLYFIHFTGDENYTVKFCKE